MKLLIAMLAATLAAAGQIGSDLRAIAGKLAPSLDCSIDGTVVNQITHEPVPRAKVILVSPGGNQSGAADNSGYFSFSNAGCANVTIDVNRVGFLNSGQIGSPPLDLVLSPDSPAHVTVELMPQAVITGKVVDENGDPVMGMRVVPYIARVVDGKREMRNAQMAVTDDRGEFRIPQLEPGRYIVCADPAMGQTGYARSCTPAPLEAGPASAVKISPGQESEFDFALTRIQPASISGVVTGLPPGTTATVQLGAGSALNPLGQQAATGVSSEGKFSIRGVPPGSYTLTASAMHEQSPLFARMPLELGPGGAENLVLALEPLITVSGTVRLESTAEPGASAERTQIALRSSEPYARMGRIEWSDDHRSFTISNVTPGRYTLVVSTPDGYVKTATLGGRDILHGEFTVDSASGPMEIVLSRDGGSIEGDVVLDDGSPATKASVMLLRSGEFVRMIGVINGHFTVHNLAPGDYSLYAWNSLRDVEYGNPEWLKQYAAGAATIAVQADETAQVKLVRQTVPAEY